MQTQVDQKQGLVGHLEFKAVREAFPEEDRHFTPWLEQHLDLLGQRLGMEFRNVQREVGVGPFSVDLLCEDTTGRHVVIENQLEKTDHDHLGKLLTYLVNLDAVTAVWVATEPVAEHQRVIQWLNDNTPADDSFILVRVEAVRVDESRLAPLFTVIAGPDPQIKRFAEVKTERAEFRVNLHDFWKTLLDKGKDKIPPFAGTEPGWDTYLSAKAGRAGVSFSFVLLKGEGAIQLNVLERAVFDALAAQKAEIERDFGGDLDWQRPVEENRSCRIRKRFTDGGLARPGTWETLQNEMVDAMMRLYNSLQDRLARVHAPTASPSLQDASLRDVTTV